MKKLALIAGLLAIFGAAAHAAEPEKKEGPPVTAEGTVKPADASTDKDAVPGDEKKH